MCLFADLELRIDKRFELAYWQFQVNSPTDIHLNTTTQVVDIHKFARTAHTRRLLAVAAQRFASKTFGHWWNDTFMGSCRLRNTIKASMALPEHSAITSSNKQFNTRQQNSNTPKHSNHATVNKCT